MTTCKFPDCEMLVLSLEICHQLAAKIPAKDDKHGTYPASRERENGTRTNVKSDWIAVNQDTEKTNTNKLCRKKPQFFIFSPRSSNKIKHH